MKPKIIGARHAIELESLLFEKIDKQIAGIKGNKVKVGLEVVKQKERQQQAWKRLIAHLQRNKRVQIVFLENPTGERICDKSAEYYQELEFRWMITGLRPSKKQKKELDKGKYVLFILRDQSLLRRIKKSKPDVAVVGAEHAFFIGEKMGVKPIYVGCKEADVAKDAKRYRAELKYLTDAKMQRRAERKRTFRRPKKMR